jgi:hypothetical protein
VKQRRPIHRFLAAVAALSSAAILAAAAPAYGHEPKCSLEDQSGRAELFATNNTAVITDPGDVRLRDPLQLFDIQVDQIILRSGAVAPESTVVDGVFWSDELQQTTYERSRDFHLCGVDAFELHSVADEVRRQFNQQSVLTFEYLPQDAPGIDAVKIEVPAVDVARFRDALATDPVARQRLVGGSVTDTQTLILVADVADYALASQLVLKSGGPLQAAAVEYGRRAFVE